MVWPVLQAYVPPPLAVSVPISPLQIVALVAEATGGELTETVTLEGAVHPYITSVTVNVYPVAVAGEIIMEELVEPLLHWYVTPPPTVLSVVLCPLQMFVFPNMGGFRILTTVTNAEPVSEQIPFETTTE